MHVKDLVLTGLIGVYPREQTKPQRIRINLTATVTSPDDPLADELGSVVNYEAMVAGTKALVQNRHVALVETLAEQIAQFCLEDLRVHQITVQVEKLDVFSQAAAVGITIHRRQSQQLV